MLAKSLWTKWMALIFTIALLAACGGGGGGGGGGNTPPINPKTIAVGTSYPESISAYDTNYYKFTTGSSGIYTIGLTDTQSNLGWTLHSDANYSFPILYECDAHMAPGAADEICSLSLSSATTYYLAVDEWDVVAGTYVLTVTPPGSLAAPTGVSAVGGFTKTNITWSPVTGATSYNLYWSTLPGVTKSNGTKISNVSSSPYLHTGLSNSTTYHYVVTAANLSGESAESSEVFATTAASQPASLFSENFDGVSSGLPAGWSTNGAWGVSTNYSHSASKSVTDSPALSNYPDNSDTTLTLPAVSLVGSSVPTLTFWHRYEIENLYDFGYVEVSVDGGAFANITPGTYHWYTGDLLSFTQATVDLTPYKNSSNVVLRFRLVTDWMNYTNFDGWYIDDVVITPY